MTVLEPGQYEPEPFDWDVLREQLEAGKVVPVIGRDLLEIERPEGRVLYYHHVARHLAEALGVDPGAKPDLAEVLARFQSSAATGGRDPKEKIKEILSESTPIPASLLALARIAGTAPLRLFLSTTPDDLLYRALTEVLPGSKIGHYACALQSSEMPTPEALDGLDRGGERMVVRLFGQPALGQFYFSDDEMLEVIHNLQLKLSEGGELRQLGALLKEKHLLFIGCGFPDWLMRFFIRALRGYSFRDKAAQPTRLAEADVDGKARLVMFLEQHRAQVYEGAPAEFVMALEKVWSTGRPAPRPKAPRVVLAHTLEDEGKVKPYEDKLREWGIPCDHIRWPAPSLEDVQYLFRKAVAYVAFVSRVATEGDSLFREWAELDLRMKKSDERFPFKAQVLFESDELKKELEAPTSPWRKMKWFKMASVSVAPKPDEAARLLAIQLLESRALPVQLPVKIHVVHAAGDKPSGAAFARQLQPQKKWLELSTNQLSGGDSVAVEQRRRIAEARVIVVFESSDLLEGMYEPEINLVKERRGEALIYLVRVRPIDTNLAAELSAMVLPEGGGTVSEFNADKVWSDVARCIVDGVLASVLGGAT
jgi:hypothetical protein